jgi:hypothetical protein
MLNKFPKRNLQKTAVLEILSFCEIYVFFPHSEFGHSIPLEQIPASEVLPAVVHGLWHRSLKKVTPCGKSDQLILHLKSAKNSCS